MSDLTAIERAKLEQFFGMASGYVLNFSNRTFQEFVVGSTGRNIYDRAYSKGSGSKASRLRAFWSREPNHIVGKLLADLLEYCRAFDIGTDQKGLYDACDRIAARLQQPVLIQDIEAISPDGEQADFDVLARSVRDAIERNEPQSGLDRLHTFVMKYLRSLCQKRGISADKGKPLHSLLGEYVKGLRQEGLIESKMTERILKSSISVMDAFSGVRNDQSFAHDNPVLNYNESVLIFNYIAATMGFIKRLESSRQNSIEGEDSQPEKVDDLPF